MCPDDGHPREHRVDTVAKWGQKCYIWDTFSQKETIMEHYIVIHTVSGESSVETFQRLFNTAEDAKKFAMQVADSYKVDSPDAKITDSEDTVMVSYGDGETTDYLFIQQVVYDSTERHCPHCGGRVVPSYRWQCPSCDEDFYDFECAPSEEEE